MDMGIADVAVVKQAAAALPELRGCRLSRTLHAHSYMVLDRHTDVCEFNTNTTLKLWYSYFIELPKKIVKNGRSKTATLIAMSSPR